MKKMLVLGGSLMMALASAACDGGGGPVSQPINPFGTEPTTGRTAVPSDDTGATPSPPPNATIDELCFYACSNVMSQCPAFVDEGECSSDCSGIDIPSVCEESFKAYFRCLATASVTCLDTSIEAPACDSARFAAMSCFQ